MLPAVLAVGQLAKLEHRSCLFQKTRSSGKQMRSVLPTVDFCEINGNVPHMPSSAATGYAVRVLQYVATPAYPPLIRQKLK